MNEGNGMNATDGKFTAPAHGIYVFHFSGTALSSTYLQVRYLFKINFKLYLLFKLLLPTLGHFYDKPYFVHNRSL